MALATEMMAGGMSAFGARAVNGVVNSAVSAAGTTLATATALKASHAIVTTVGSGAGVALPDGEVGDSVYVYNSQGTNILTVYPATASQQIGRSSAGAGVSLPPYTAMLFKRATSTVWTPFLSA